MGNLLKEQQIFLNLSSVKPAKDINIENVDWNLIGKESITQAVLLCCFENAFQFKDLIPEQIYSKWQKFYLKKIQTNAYVVYSQDNLVKLLDNKFNYVILKGLTSASYYNKPENRCLGDVDFLIKKEDEERISKLLIKNGYVKSNDDNDHHIVFKKENEHLEMHFEIPGVPFGKSGDIIREYVKSIFDTSKKINLDLFDKTYCFYAPSDAMHGLILLLHTEHHLLSEGIGLRHLSDWAYFIEKTYKFDFWENELIPFLKKIGLFTFASALTKTCALYLNSELPSWCKDFSNDICFELINDILTLGNFGINDREKSKSGVLISEHGKYGTRRSKIRNLFTVYNKNINTKHKSLAKHPFLYPIFFVSDFFVYLYGAIFKKRSKVTSLLSEADKRKKVYDKLKIFKK